MSEPENKEVIILKNKYYPSGLREIDIWDYYIKNRNLILSEAEGRHVVFWIATKENETVLVRNIKGMPIYFSFGNYSKLITGRTLTIGNVIKSNENEAIIDIDCDDFDLAKQATLDVYDFIIKNTDIFNGARIRFTGKTGFHIICYLNRTMNINLIRDMLKTIFAESYLIKKYTVSNKRTPGIPNIDLSIMKENGIFIMNGSLSILGLRCVDVPYKYLKVFKPEMAKIKT